MVKSELVARERGWRVGGIVVGEVGVPADRLLGRGSDGGVGYLERGSIAGVKSWETIELVIKETSEIPHSQLTFS